MVKNSVKYDMYKFSYILYIGKYFKLFCFKCEFNYIFTYLRKNLTKSDQNNDEMKIIFLFNENKWMIMKYTYEILFR